MEADAQSFLASDQITRWSTRNGGEEFFVF